MLGGICSDQVCPLLGDGPWIGTHGRLPLQLVSKPHRGHFRTFNGDSIEKGEKR